MLATAEEKEEEGETTDGERERGKGEGEARDTKAERVSNNRDASRAVRSTPRSIAVAGIFILLLWTSSAFLRLLGSSAVPAAEGSAQAGIEAKSMREEVYMKVSGPRAERGGGYVNW